MTPVQMAALVMALLGGALGCFRRSQRRAPATVALARRQMLGEAASEGGGTADGLLVRPIAFVESALGSGLTILDRSARDVVASIVTAFIAVFVVVLAGVVVLTQVSPLPWSMAWLCGAVVIGAGAALAVWRGIGARVRRQRDEVRRAAADFVQLVAVGLTTDHSVEDAIRFALDVGEGDAFEVIRNDLLAAPQRGLAVWDALREVAALYEIRELDEFASSVERQGLQGVSIGATIASMAQAMRERSLDELERAADKANANLAGPTIGFVVATVAFLAFPLAQRIGDAFGG